jgi:hypothetical protein
MKLSFFFVFKLQIIVIFLPVLKFNISGICYLFIFLLYNYYNLYDIHTIKCTYKLFFLKCVAYNKYNVYVKNKTRK